MDATSGDETAPDEAKVNEGSASVTPGGAAALAADADAASPADTANAGGAPTAGTADAAPAAEAAQAAAAADATPAADAAAAAGATPTAPAADAAAAAGAADGAPAADPADAAAAESADANAAPATSAAPRTPIERNPAKTFDEYLGPAIFTPLSAVVLEKAAPQAGERVLDLACGTGIVTVQLPVLVGETGKVVGVDLAAPMLAVAAAKDVRGIEWREGNGCALVDLDNGAFDLLICQQGLQFFAERDTGASEMRRVLAPTGRAVVACWKNLEEQSMFQQLVESQSRVLNIPMETAAAPYSLGDGATLKTVLEDAGFETVEITEHDLEVTFADPAEFVRRTTVLATARLPHVAEIDLDDAADSIAKVLAPVLAHYTKDGALVVTLKTNIAIAKR